MSDEKKAPELFPESVERQLRFAAWYQREHAPLLTKYEKLFNKGCQADQEFLEAKERIAKLEGALRLMATPKRPDGTYNRSREACEQLARAALEGKE